MKQFDIPLTYRSSFISQIKNKRKNNDPRKKDFSPTLLDFGPIQFLIARHFGFCYGVENAIEIAYKAVEENPDKKIYLLSQMIHNPTVNQDLRAMGISFIMDTLGNQFVPWSEIRTEDVVIIPAFGTTLEIEEKLKKIGVEIQKYNTTCPFVTRVWKQSEKLGKEGFSVIIHGKSKHEETRATFSHSSENSNSIVVRGMKEAKLLGNYMLGKLSKELFEETFDIYSSEGFNPDIHLEKVGVVNQTTMLASDTQAIADYFKQIMIQKYGEDKVKEHFADTRDTLCYATNDNQQATYGLLKVEADLAIVVGGFNSSNTSHLVELCEEKMPTYFISGAHDILNQECIRHFDFRRKKTLMTKEFLPSNTPLKMILTSGASCPDAVVDEVMDRILSFFETERSKEELLETFSIFN
ncbi:MAG: 4-hydroxy-3-methylbut-2-enyl diphosphate reductase [Verrucomicrobia bacterium]|nr:4-hydroxy-3-methylbut-2-enyl diphosphate reductase [Verrucomicrobiota bacterium]